ncbi:MAG: hypothetical protein R3F59_13995 [Myxococcota bacterium]
MTEDPPILRYAALSAPAVAVCVAAGLGVDHGLATAVGSALVLLNFWLLSLLGPRVVASVARDEPPVFWVLALLAKFVLLVGAFALLFRVLPAFGLMLGFVPMLVGTLGAGVHYALREAAEERQAAARAAEER